MERETPRLIIRDLVDADTTAYARYLEANEDHLRPWSPLRAHDFRAEENVRKLIATRAELAAAKAGYALGLFRKADLCLIGTVEVTNIVYGVFQSCNLGYELSEGAVGSGYMSEALVAVVEFCFAELGLHRVEANVMPRNGRSKSLLRRLGFRSEGLCRKYLRINGIWEDHERFVLLNSALE